MRDTGFWRSGTVCGLLKESYELLGHFRIVVRIDSHSPRKGAEMLLLAVGPLNRFPLVGQLGDAAITDLRDAIQAIVDESCERYLRGIRFKLFCSISNELARHVRHGTGNVRLPFGT